MKDIKTEWDLEKYYFKSINDERIELGIKEDLNSLDLYAKKYKGNISTLNDEDFLSFLINSDSLCKNITKASYYYSYLSTLNTQDQEVIKKTGELSNVWANVQELCLFIDEEYKEIGYSKFIERSNLELFSSYKNSLVNSANNLKYLLPEAQEKNLIEIGKITSIFGDIYTELTNSFEFDYRGEKKNESEIQALRMSKDEDERRDATNALLSKFSDNKIVLGNIYKSVCKDNVADIKIRGYEDVMHTRNFSEEMEKNTVDKLLNTVKSNYHLYHRHLKNKARFFGKEKLNYHDVIAPIVSDAKSEYSFEEGLKFYLDKIEGFDKEFYDYSIKLFQDGLVSVFPSQNKESGAYASYDKNKESFVLLNYTNNLNSIMTLAHELGHAIHGYYSQEQTRPCYHPVLSLAETASIFNETFVFEEILNSVSEKDKDFYIMENLDGIFSTMFRQVMYIDFERECHERILNGEELSYEDFNEIWLRKMKELLGENVIVPDEVGCGWSIIPHIFHTPFYCYSYSFGNILSFNLYKTYKDSKDKSEFITMYKNILKSGGSKRPKDLLIENGIDITSDEFYNKAFEVINELLLQVELDKIQNT